MLDERDIKRNDGGIDSDIELAGRFDASARPIGTVDVEKYQSFLDESDLTDSQKEEFLDAIWSIVVSFVELGFGVHPLQEVCGQNSEICSQRPKDAFDRVRSEELD